MDSFLSRFFFSKSSIVVLLPPLHVWPLRGAPAILSTSRAPYWDGIPTFLFLVPPDESLVTPGTRALSLLRTLVFLWLWRLLPPLARRSRVALELLKSIPCPPADTILPVIVLRRWATLIEAILRTTSKKYSLINRIT